MNPQTLRTLREQAGLNRAALAERSGVAQSTVHRIESGERTQIRADTQHRIAGALADALHRDKWQVLAELVEPRAA